MAAKELLVHVRLPAEVVAALDKLARVRRLSRNRFIAEAVTEKLAREQRVLALRETRGTVGPEDADWAGAPAVEWVRKIRSAESQRLR